MDRRRQQRLSLDLLRGFRAAAKHLSFTRAAHELFVTQPAISREVKTLEEQLGQPLFKRVNRTLQLTDAGRELYRAADDALNGLDAATERIGRSARRLSVTTTTALASLWLAPKLPRFTKLHPGIDVRVAASDDLVDIEREHVDIALRFIPPWMDEPRAELLVDYAIFPVCAPSVAASRKNPLRALADLSRHVMLDFEILLYGKPWSDWERWLEAKEMRDFRPAGALRFGHYDQVIQSAVAGAGVAIGKWPHTLRELRDGTLVAPLGMDAVARLGGYYFIIRPEVADSDVIQACVAFMRDEVRRDRAVRFDTPSARKTASRREAGSREAARASR
jgi:DNA-binding transcriptional LysR family regulator